MTRIVKQIADPLTAAAGGNLVKGGKEKLKHLAVREEGPIRGASLPEELLQLPDRSGRHVGASPLVVALREGERRVAILVRLLERQPT